MKIGLLGGSFNPPHEGHLSLSRQALEILQLNQIWWLVSPQNPNKPSFNMQSFEKRFELCQEITKNDTNIICSNLERKNNQNYSYKSLSLIINQYPQNDFIWIIGADNLLNFHEWKNWQEIFETVKIAVVDRENFKEKSLNSAAALTYKNYKVNSSEIFNHEAPSWCFLDIKKNNASSSKIRLEQMQSI